MKSNGVVVYRGPSLLTGDPIVVVLTGFTHPSDNFKTGPMIQAWVLRADQKPTEAVKSGGDDAICGDCKHRSGSNIGRSCYVIWWLGPQNVYRALDSYPFRLPSSLAPLLKNHFVRMSAYGDPAAVPTNVWIDLAHVAKGWTGYTHHWRTCDQLLRLVLMASVDSEAEMRAAMMKGWRTFRCRSANEPLKRDETICPASEEGGHVTTCLDCNLCSGLNRNAKSVAIYAHGQRIKWFANAAAI